MDTQPPLFLSGYPLANNAVSQTGFGAVTTEFDVVAKLDEPGTVYYVAFPASDASDANKGSGLPGSRAPSPRRCAPARTTPAPPPRWLARSR